MANVENIVKVMKFHSLVRVDKAKRKAEKYLKIGKELVEMISEILYNKNFNLDKKILNSNEKGIELNIYVANDLGFCGNFNSLVMKCAKEDKEAKKIIIGSKIKSNYENVLLSISKEEYYNNFNKVEEVIYPLFINKEIKSITVIYNHYYSVNDIELVYEKIFPTEIENKDINLNLDYVIETDINMILTELIILYIWYQLKIIECNSWASENVMRERITRESLKKIDEIKEEKIKEERKIKKQNDLKKIISNYRK